MFLQDSLISVMFDIYFMVCVLWILGIWIWYKLFAHVLLNYSALLVNLGLWFSNYVFFGYKSRDFGVFTVMGLWKFKFLHSQIRNCTVENRLGFSCSDFFVTCTLLCSSDHHDSPLSPHRRRRDHHRPITAIENTTIPPS